jgi:hypothetical protein
MFTSIQTALATQPQLATWPAGGAHSRVLHESRSDKNSSLYGLFGMPCLDRAYVSDPEGHT